MHSTSTHPDILATCDHDFAVGRELDIRYPRLVLLAGSYLIPTLHIPDLWKKKKWKENCVIYWTQLDFGTVEPHYNEDLGTMKITLL